MSENHSLANKKKWAKVPKDEKSKVMSLRGKAKWDSLTPRQKKIHINKMVNAKKLKALSK